MDNFRPYLQCKDSGVAWLGEIPTHWDIKPGFAAYREKQEKNIGLIEKTVLSLSYGRIVVKPPEKLHGLVPESFETYQIINPGDIIIRATDLQNDWNSLRVGFTRNRGIITSAYLCLKPTGLLSSEYNYYVLHAYDLKKIFYGMGSGLRQNLAFTDLKRMPIPVPPKEEQDAIVRYLNHFNREIDNYIGVKRKLIALLNEQKLAIIHTAITRGLDSNLSTRPSGVEWLGDVPEYWEVKRLKWVTRLQRGYDLPQDQRKPGTIPVISSGGVIDNHCEARAYGPGVVMGRYGSTEAVFFIETDFWPHNTSLFVTDFHGNFRKWCFYLLRTISKADHASKSAVPGVDRKDLYEIYVPQPPLEEQISIVENIEQRLKVFDATIGSAQREINLIREYRTRIIADVVTGKLDVREAAANLPDKENGPKEFFKSEEVLEEDPEILIAEVSV